MRSIIKVDLPENPYQIIIAPGSLNQLGAEMAQFQTEKKIGKKVLVVSNPEIFEYYGQTVIESLQLEGFEISSHLIPAGEQYKTLNSIQGLYDKALHKRLERSSTLVALGGGVIGDMTGFAAATWLRGVNFVQVPTSLLAMVDASVGGKTGVNHPQGKNLIGAFYQPKLVLIDPLVLKTLPVKEFRAGMAEVIKYGIIWDRQLFELLEQHPSLGSLDEVGTELLQEILERSCQAKAEVVRQDEKEGGIRAILNYGHTLGHAIESLTGYTKYLHGEGVAIGMVGAAEIARMMGMWQQEEVERQRALILKGSLPTQIPKNLDPKGIIESLQSDKKVKSGKVRFILPTEIGKVIISDQVENEVLLKCIHLCQS